jgi:predicted enzyme related to lactoylglutathione lyase
LIYFSCADLANELGRVEAAGGTVIKPKTAIGEGYGFTALFKDTEGNRVALHSQI